MKFETLRSKSARVREPVRWIIFNPIVSNTKRVFLTLLRAKFFVQKISQIEAFEAHHVWIILFNRRRFKRFEEIISETYDVSASKRRKKSRRTHGFDDQTAKIVPILGSETIQSFVAKAHLRENLFETSIEEVALIDVDILPLEIRLRVLRRFNILAGNIKFVFVPFKQRN